MAYDLFVALTAAAAATSKLRIASGICLVIERDPITTAKEVASVDHLSGGRLEFGVGAGWCSIACCASATLGCRTTPAKTCSRERGSCGTVRIARST